MIRRPIDKVNPIIFRAIEEALAQAGFKGIISDLLADNKQFAEALRDISRNKGCDDACSAIALAALNGIDTEYEAMQAEAEG